MQNTKTKSFSGTYAFLSNFYAAPLTYNNIRYKNSEAAFQAQKDPDRQQAFADLSPREAKSLGRKVNLRRDWDDVKLSVMQGVIRAKFTQNNDLKQRLINTGDEPLIERNWWGDTYWGVCNGIGENHLGKILTNLRDELRGD